MAYGLSQVLRQRPAPCGAQEDPRTPRWSRLDQPRSLHGAGCHHPPHGDAWTQRPLVV